MKINDIDVLLKESLSEEFSPCPELENRTWQKMNAIPPKKRWELLKMYKYLSLKYLIISVFKSMLPCNFTISKKRWFLLTLAGIICFALSALVAIVILSFIQHTMLQIIFLHLYTSTVYILIFYAIISINLNIKIKQTL